MKPVSSSACFVVRHTVSAGVAVNGDDDAHRVGTCIVIISLEPYKALRYGNSPWNPTKLSPWNPRKLFSLEPHKAFLSLELTGKL